MLKAKALFTIRGELFAIASESFLDKGEDQLTQ